MTKRNNKPQETQGGIFCETAAGLTTAGASPVFPTIDSLWVHGRRVVDLGVPEWRADLTGTHAGIACGPMLSTSDHWNGERRRPWRNQS